MEDKAVAIIKTMFHEIVSDARDADFAVAEMFEDVVDELELTRKESGHLKKLINGEKVTFLQAMALLEKAVVCDYYLMDDEVDAFDFIFEKEHNRKFRNTKKFIKNYRKFQ